MNRILTRFIKIFSLFLILLATACAKNADNLAPVITITAPHDNYPFPASRGLTLQVIADSPNSDLGTIEIFVDGQSNLILSVPPDHKDHYETEIPLSTWTAGDYAITAIAITSSNNKSSPSTIRVTATEDIVSTPGSSFNPLIVVVYPIPKESGTGFSSRLAMNSDERSKESWPLVGEIPGGNVLARGVVSFDISKIPPNAVIDLAQIKLNYEVRGQPFLENGNLMIDAIYYGTTIPKDVYDIGSFATVYNSEVEPIREIDIVDALKFALRSGYPRFQILLKFLGVPSSNDNFDAMLIDVNNTELRIIYR